jgi:hypothetical protein
MTFNTLPGTQFILNDSTLSVTPPASSGDTILVFGCALDGPTNVPVSLQGLNLESLFGPALFDSNYVSPDNDPTKKGTYSANSLVKACSEVVNGGGANIVLVRIGGNLATSSTPILGGVTAQALFPGNLYNGAQLSAVSTAMGGTTLTIVNQPANKGGQGVVFQYPATYTYGQVCNSFNGNRLNKTFQLRCPSTVASGTAVSQPRTLASLTLAGGTNGTMAQGDDFYANKEAMFTAITQDGGALAQTAGINADLIVVADLYADDDVSNSASASFLTNLALFCHEQSNSNYQTLGIIGTRPLADTSRVGINNHVNDLITVNAGIYDDIPSKQVNVAQFIQSGIPYDDPDNPGGQTVDLGRYLSIIAGPDLVYSSTSLGSYVDSGATFYAGMVSGLVPQQATTNQPLGGSVALAYTFTKDQRNLLNAGVNYTGQGDGLGGGAYVTFTLRQPGTGAVIVTEDVTASARTSSFTNLQFMRIIQAAERVVEGICLNFIGQANDPGTVATLESQLQSGLDVMGNQGALFGGRGSGYDFTIGSNTADGQLGIIRIDMWLRPAREIKRIITTVTVHNS